MLTLRRSVVGVVAVLLLSGVAFAQTPVKAPPRATPPRAKSQRTFDTPAQTDEKKRQHAAVRCSCGRESLGNAAVHVSTTATKTRGVRRNAAKMLLKANRLLTRPACIAGVLVSRQNCNALCGLTTL
jgi:hypothetical protein